MKKNRGITLIALVITIIVLLILAGISIATLMGNNGILSKANTAKDDTKKAEYEEILKLIGAGLKTDKIMEQLSTKEFMDRYQKEIEDEIKKGQQLKDAEMRRKDDNNLVVVTKEGYVFLVTENDVICLGEQEGENPPDLTEENVTFNVSPAKEWTNTDVSLEVATPIEGYILEYSKDEINWTVYTGSITMKENGKVFVRLSNGLEQAGKSIKKEITSIDKKGPTGAIEFGEITTSSIAITVNAEDPEATDTEAKSGIKGYCYSSDGGNNYTDLTTETTHTFTDLQPGVEYNIWVKVTDNADNETILKEAKKTVEPIYLIKEGKIVQDKTGYGGENGGSTFKEKGGYVYCHLFGGGGYGTSVYWELPQIRKGAVFHIKLTAPSISLDGYTQDAGGYVFATNTRPPGYVANESGYAGWTSGNRRQIRPNDSGYFTSQREFKVTNPAEGTLYCGIQKYYRGNFKSRATFNIYDAWIE